MTVLSTIFSNPRQIPLDIAGVMLRTIERRRQEKYHAVIRSDQLLVSGCHCTRPTPRFSSSAYDSPALRDRIDSTLRILRGAKWRSIVEIGSPVPVTVPSFAFERCFQRTHVQPPRFCTLALPARIRDLGKLPKNRMQEPAKPHTFAFSVLTNAVHAIVPIAGTHQWQAVHSNSES